MFPQVGAGLLQHFGGQAVHLVSAAGGSALRLVELITAHFPGFRDHAVYAGRQVSGRRLWEQADNPLSGSVHDD